MDKNEAIKIIRSNFPTGRIILCEALETLIPELKEDEDEKIRKGLIDFLKSPFVSENITDEKVTPWIAWLEKQGERKQHLELKAGHWYFCHQAYCERADILTVKEGERFQCEKDGVVKGLVIKEPAKYFTECDAPAHMEIEQKPAWSEDSYEKALNTAIKYYLTNQI